MRHRLDNLASYRGLRCGRRNVARPQRLQIRSGIWLGLSIGYRPWKCRIPRRTHRWTSCRRRITRDRRHKRLLRLWLLGCRRVIRCGSWRCASRNRGGCSRIGSSIRYRRPCGSRRSTSGRRRITRDRRHKRLLRLWLLGCRRVVRCSSRRCASRNRGGCSRVGSSIRYRRPCGSRRSTSGRDWIPGHCRQDTLLGFWFLGRRRVVRCSSRRCASRNRSGCSRVGSSIGPGDTVGARSFPNGPNST